MTELNIWLLVGSGLFAGLIGSMLGVGGGFFIVPILTLVMHIPIKIAIGSSLVAIVANASLAASRYAKTQLSNVKLGLLLCSTAVPGAIIGGFLSKISPPVILSTFFGVLLIYVAYTMMARQSTLPDQQDHWDSSVAATDIDIQNIARYYDKAAAKFVGYRINHIPQGLGGSFFAGLLSSLLGIGGGVVQIPVMNIIMTVPIKAAIGTSTFIMAITTAVGALVYYYHGYIHPFVVAPLLLGILPGALIGTTLTERIGTTILRRAFGILLFITAILMFLKAANLI